MTLSRSAVSRGISVGCSASMISRARANPTAPGVFCVPDRFLDSCPPPRMSGANGRALLQVERAEPLGTVDLVAGEGRGVDAKGVNVERDLADRLRGVGVHERATLVRDLRELGDRVDRADLVVAVHHRDELGVRSHRLPQIVGVDVTVLARLEQRQFMARLAELLGRLENGVVLERGDDQVRAALGRDPCERAEERRVVGLGSAAREDDFAGTLGADAGRYRLTSLLQRAVGVAAQGVEGVGIPETLAEERQHRVEHTRIHGSGCCVVEVDGVHCGPLP